MCWVSFMGCDPWIFSLPRSETFGVVIVLKLNYLNLSFCCYFVHLFTIFITLVLLRLISYINIWSFDSAVVGNFLSFCWFSLSLCTWILNFNKQCNLIPCRQIEEYTRLIASIKAQIKMVFLTLDFHRLPFRTI